jgi:hypothetical protein
VLDVAAGVAALAAPYVLKRERDKEVWGTFWAMGVVGIVVGTLSVLGAKRRA